MLNAKWYIGSHNGNYKNYFGSSKVLNKAIKKHGKENFIKVILCYGPDFRERERSILKELKASKCKHSYNLKDEALGCALKGHKNPMFGKKLTAEEKFVCGSAFRGKKRPEHSEKMKGENNPMFGKNFQAKGLIKRGKWLKGKKYEDIYGKEKSEEIVNKFSKSLKGLKHNLKEVQCFHCCLKGSGPNMTRYHFDKCLLNPINPKNIIGKYSPIKRQDKRKDKYKCPHCWFEGMNIGNMKRWHFDNCKNKRREGIR